MPRTIRQENKTEDIPIRKDVKLSLFEDDTVLYKKNVILFKTILGFTDHYLNIYTAPLVFITFTKDFLKD